jgi:hypothetical protein
MIIKSIKIFKQNVSKSGGEFLTLSYLLLITQELQYYAGPHHVTRINFTAIIIRLLQSF